LGPCRQSVGRGTRYNARKITTDESYFTTKIYEFQLKCQNCQHPWVIRTNPKERAFDYVCGVKLQAGQISNITTDSSNFSNSTKNPDHLVKLESTVCGKVKELTEIEDLQRIRKLNNVSASVNDADTNATIRKLFRIERKEKRRRFDDARKQGWRDGMQLLSSNDNDIIAANETCYGRPHNSEKRKLSSIRMSSIFFSVAMNTKTNNISKNRRTADVRQRKPQPKRRPDDIISNNTTRIYPVERDICDKTEKTNYVADEVYSSVTDNSKEQKSVKKKTLKLRKGQYGLSILEKEGSIVVEEKIRKTDDGDDIGTCMSDDTKNLLSTTSKKEPLSSLLEMLTAYNSDDEDR